MEKAALFAREERAARTTREKNEKSCVHTDAVDLCTPPTRRRLSFSRVLAAITNKCHAQASTQAKAFGSSRKRRAVIHMPMIAKRQPHCAQFLRKSAFAGSFFVHDSFRLDKAYLETLMRFPVSQASIHLWLLVPCQRMNIPLYYAGK